MDRDKHKDIISVTTTDELLDIVNRVVTEGLSGSQSVDIEFHNSNSTDYYRLTRHGDALNILFANNFTRPIVPSLKQRIQTMPTKMAGKQLSDVTLTDVYESYRHQSAQLGYPVHPPETETPWQSIDKVSRQQGQQSEAKQQKRHLFGFFSGPAKTPEKPDAEPESKDQNKPRSPR